jgi:hypothetical protein
MVRSSKRTRADTRNQTVLDISGIHVSPHSLCHHDRVGSGAGGSGLSIAATTSRQRLNLVLSILEPGVSISFPSL